MTQPGDVPGWEPEMEALRWAVGAADAALPPFAALDSARLRELVGWHRVAGRFRSRLRRERGDWEYGDFREWLHTESARGLVGMGRRRDALRELAALLPAAHPPICLKGWTACALTGDAAAVRPSGDLDLLCADAEGAWDALIALGYTGGRGEKNQHEYAQLRRAAVVVEIHRHFPVYSYPEGVSTAGTANLSPRNHPGLWVQSFGATPQPVPLDYGAVRRAAVSGSFPGFEGLLLPDPALAAFVLCAHEFKEMMQSPLVLSVPVRLALLAEVRDLIQHPAFDPARFANLVREFRAGDAVRLIGHLLRVVFGADVTLPTSATAEPAAPDAAPARALGFRGGWVALASAREWLAGLPRAVLFDRLGTAPVVVTPDKSPPAWYRAGSLEGGQPAQRAILHRASGLPLALRFALRAQDRSVRLLVELPGQPLSAHQEYRVRVDGCRRGGGRFVAVTGSSTAGTDGELSGLAGEGEGRAAVTHTAGGGFSFTLEVPWETLLPAQSAQGAPVLALLTVARRDRRVPHFFDAEQVIVLPVEIGKERM